ncbi:unnamed protein product [Linum tenue]|uniref:Uncharacterized protein n=2 Tax=Linum tenue TaxID=586396 RepID=A0AAV0H7W4_9ROSI|nr:unnamed protein product [Linum tenue]
MKYLWNPHIKEAIPNSPLEKSEVIGVVTLRACKELKRNNGMKIRYDDNVAVAMIKKEIQRELEFLVRSHRS